jgi:hypothetical protein
MPAPLVGKEMSSHVYPHRAIMKPRCRWVVHSLLLALVLLSWPREGRAGVIALVPSSQLEVHTEGSSATFRGAYFLTNRGDEVAKEVFLVFGLGRWTFATGEGDVPPGETIEWKIEQPIPLERLACSAEADDPCAGQQLPLRGVFPLQVTRQFRDANGHPFTAVSVQTIRIGGLDERSERQRSSSATPSLEPVFGVDETSASGLVGRLAVSNPAAVARAVSASLVLPLEYTSTTPPFLLELDAGGVAEAEIGLSRYNALLGSSYEVVAVLQWSEQGSRRTSLASAFVQAQGSDLSGAYLWTLAWTSALAISVLLVVWRPGARSHGGASGSAVATS